MPLESIVTMFVVMSGLVLLMVAIFGRVYDPAIMGMIADTKAKTRSDSSSFKFSFGRKGSR